MTSFNNTELAQLLLNTMIENLHVSHNMALLRSSLDKHTSIKLRLFILFIKNHGTSFPITIDDLCQLTNSTRQYCGNVIKQLVQQQLIVKRYGCIELLDFNGMLNSFNPEIIDFISCYMPINKHW